MDTSGITIPRRHQWANCFAIISFNPANFSKISSAMTQATQTPVRRGAVPAGHLLAAAKWCGTDLGKLLQKLGQVKFSDTLGVVDFHPSAEVAVLYVTEADIVGGNDYRKKIVKLRKANCMRGVIVVEHTQVTEQYFQHVQKFIVLELGLQVVPVASIQEAAEFLAQLVVVEAKPSNPFRAVKPQRSDNEVLLEMVKLIPKLGEIKAKLLLSHYKSIHALCNSSVGELKSIVGNSVGEEVYNFLCTRKTE